MRVVVIGAGEVGGSIATNLSDHHDVLVIDIDSERLSNLSKDSDIRTLEGDGTSLEVLKEAGLPTVDILIASTDDDQTNLVACSTASVLGDAFTIARVRNTNFLTTWQRSQGAYGVDFMVCTNLLTAETIVRIAGLGSAHDVDTFAGGRIQMAEFDVPDTSPLVGSTIEDADQVEGLTFAAIIKDNDVVLPTGETIIESGVRVVVIGTPERVSAFAERLTPDSESTRNIVVIGGDAIGSETVRLLCERGVAPTTIEADEGRARSIAEAEANAVVLNHDPTDVDFLLQEHVDKADLAVVTLESDEQTLLVSLLIQQIGTRRTVAVVEAGEYVDLFEAVGVDVAINPRELTAEEITRFTHDERTENIALIESDQAEVLEVEVKEGSILVGRPLGEVIADLPTEVIVGAITRNGEVIAPRGDTEVHVGDHVVVIVESPMVDAVLTAL